MATKSSRRVVIGIDKHIKSLMSIGVRDSGDLIIKIKTSSTYRKSNIDRSMIAKNVVDGDIIVDQKYSVHLSKNSPLGVDTIKHTLRLNNNSLDTVQYTRGIRNNLFSHIFSRRYPDLRIDRYSNMPMDKRNLILPTFEPDNFTLFTSLFVGSINSEFYANNVDYNYVKMHFRGLKLLILWSFIPIPSHFTGFLMHGMTVEDRNTRLSDSLEFNEPVKGYDRSKIDGIFRRNRDLAREEMVSVLFSEFGDVLKGYPLHMLGYFKNGSLYGDEFITRSAMVKQRKSVENVTSLILGK